MLDCIKEVEKCGRHSGVGFTAWNADSRERPQIVCYFHLFLRFAFAFARAILLLCVLLFFFSLHNGLLHIIDKNDERQMNKISIKKHNVIEITQCFSHFYFSFF